MKKVQKRYWCNEDTDDLIGTLEKKRKDLTDYNIITAIERNVRSYYNTQSINSLDSSLSQTGDNGEFVKAVMHEARSTIRAMVSMITSDRLAFEVIAMSDDESVFCVNKVAKAIISDVVNRKNLDKLQDTAVETALVYGSAYYHPTWNTSEGEPYINQGNTVLYEGDINISVLNPFEIYFDRRKKSFDDVDWVLIKKRVNKYTLMAQFPNIADDIESADTIDIYELDTNEVNTDDDLVIVYEFYHKSTPAIPGGRMTVFSNADTVYFDGDNIYDCLPVVPVVPCDIANSQWGYALYSDLMPLQEMLDNEMSCIASNHMAFGVSNIIVPDSSDLRVEDLGGMRFLKVSSDSNPPSVLNLAQTSGELFKMIDECKKGLQAISGINNTIRGIENMDKMSGVAIATLSQNALKFASPYLKANTIALEQTLLKVVKFFKMFANTERIIPIVGANQQYIAFRFDSSKIEEVKSIKIRPRNPLADSIAGRVEIANQLLDKQLIKNPQDYLRIIEHGDLNELTDEVYSEIELIESENEMLMNQQQPEALILDNHNNHIAKHKTLLNNPLIRKQNESIILILEHIQQHIGMMKNGDPMLLELAMGDSISKETVKGSGGQPTGQQMPASPAPSPAQPLPTDQTLSPLQQGVQ
jgi:hypothetical protein